ncbi:MAG: hypothetical protein U0935_08465 [Pirellulales bacterium]
MEASGSLSLLPSVKSVVEHESSKAQVLRSAGSAGLHPGSATDRVAYFGLTATNIEPVVEKGDAAVIGGLVLLGYLDHGYRVLSTRPTTDFERARMGMQSARSLHHPGNPSHPWFKSPRFCSTQSMSMPGLKDAVIELKLAGNKNKLYRLLFTA